ncbi:AtpZ/AtpI family protein [bacterium]|jgi:hypothetical protein|nr:AtpZ/AtpI family protein [bacterium]MDB2576635.1 AtpZ/AtpI family protein [Planctomycetota bacterium]MDB4401494.1 AtpZ/AtpI family protein [bacterium]
MSTSNDPSGPLGPDHAGDPPQSEGSIPNTPGAEWVGEQREVGKAAGAGIQFGLTICVFALAGLWLDGRLGTDPWLLVTGVLLSFFGGTVSLIKKYS